MAWRPAVGDWVVMTRRSHMDDPEIGTVWQVTEADGVGSEEVPGCYVRTTESAQEPSLIAVELKQSCGWTNFGQPPWRT